MVELPEGTDVNKLFTSQDTRNVDIEYKGENWRFVVRELTWKERGDVMKQAAKIDIGGKKGSNKSIAMDMTSYNITYMMKAIVKSPFGSLTMATFMKLDEKFGNLMVDAIVDPEDMTDEEEGNSEDACEV